MRRYLRGILAQVFIVLTIFLVAVLIYKIGNPYAYPDLENRILFILVPAGFILLYFYLSEEETYSRLSSGIRAATGRLHNSKYAGFCRRVLERSPSSIKIPLSKGLAGLYTYLRRLCQYIRYKDSKVLVSYAFLALLFIVAMQSIAPKPFSEWERTPLMIAAVALGAVTFYLNRDKVGEIEEEARQEEREEKRREMEFGGKFPRINRVWGVRWVARRMYKEGGWYSGGLAAIVLIGFGLRIWNLFKISYNLDEGIFYILFKNFESGVMLPTLDSGGLYLRNFIYTYTSYFINLFINDPLLSLRLVSLFFGISLLFLVYFFSKKLFNKKTALFGTFLAAIIPYLITYSIQGRHYMMLLFFYLLFLYFLMFSNCESKRTKLNFMIITLIIGLNFEFVFLLTPLLILKYIRTKNIFYILILFTIIILFFIQFFVLSKSIQYTIESGSLIETESKDIINTDILNEITISGAISKFFFIALSYLLPSIFLILINYKRCSPSQYFILNEKYYYLFTIFLVEAIFFSLFLERNQIRYRQTLLLILLMVFLYIYYRSITGESLKKTINVSLIVLVLYLVIPVNINYPVTINYEENKAITNYELLGTIFTDPLGFSSISANEIFADYSSIDKMIDKKAIIITTDLYNLYPYIKFDYIFNEYMMDRSSYIHNGKKLSIYNNIPFIDLNYLKELTATNNTILIIADSRFDAHLSSKSKKYILDNYILIAATESSNIGQINRLTKNYIKFYQKM